MVDEPTDHRRAIAARNVEAILDGVEALLERRQQPSIAAVATEAGVSRPTVYAHFPTREEMLEAVVERAVQRAAVALQSAAPQRGSPVEALDRIVTVAWRELDRNSAIAAAVQLDPAALKRTHDAAKRYVHDLVERGQADGSFRSDLSTEWLVTSFFALMHAAGDEVRAGRMDASAALDALVPTVRSVFDGSHEQAGAPGR